MNFIVPAAAAGLLVLPWKQAPRGEGKGEVIVGGGERGTGGVMMRVKTATGRCEVL